MICTKCGAANRTGAKFCDECGQSLNTPSSPPIPGPHPGMRYRRSRKEAPPQAAAPPAEPSPPGPEPDPPPPRRDPPVEVPKREAVPVRARRDVVPDARRRQRSLPEDEPLLSAEALHRRAVRDPDVEITTPAPKRKRTTGSDEHDNATIMIVLALVFFAILVVGASGVYFNLRESHPDLLRQEAERADSARNATMPLPEMANFDLPTAPAGLLPRVAPDIAPDPPAVPDIPEEIIPHSNPANPEPLAEGDVTADPDSLPFQIAQAMTEARERSPQDIPAATSIPPAQTTASYSDADVETMIRKPGTAAGKPANKGYKAQFRQLFGAVVIERTYPSMAMKQRALRLWAREQKILEPDGSINDKYAPKQEPSRIPGH